MHVEQFTEKMRKVNNLKITTKAKREKDVKRGKERRNKEFNFTHDKRKIQNPLLFEGADLPNAP